MATVETRRSRSQSRPQPSAAEAAPIDDPHRLSWAAVGFIVAYGAALLLLNLGGRALTYHEVLFAQPAREMLIGGDFIVPRIVDLPYVDKPPATAWAIATSMTLLGRENEWAARLPSVLAEIAIALLVATVAARWFDRRTGVLAACMQLTSVYTLMQARLAESDMLLTAAVTAAWASLALSALPGPAGMIAAARRGAAEVNPADSLRGLLAVAFYFAAGMSFLIKGPLGPAMILSGALSYAAIARRRDVWQWFFSPVGIGLFVACVTLWPLAAYVSYPPIVEAWRAHHWGRFTGELGGGEPPGFYLYTSLWLMLPWSPALIWAIFRAYRSGTWREPVWQFMAAWIVPGLLLLSVSRFQHKHYVIPLLPPLAVATAVGLLDYVRLRNARPITRPGIAALLIVLVGSGAIFAVVRAAPPAAAAIVMLIVVVVAGMLWLASCEARREPNRGLQSMLALAWIGSALALLCVLPSYDSYDSARTLGQEVDRQAREDGPTFLVGLPDHPSTFYIHEPLTRIDDPRVFVALTGNLRPVTHVLAPARYAADFAALGNVRTLAKQRTLPSYLTEPDRPTLFRITRTRS